MNDKLYINVYDTNFVWYGLIEEVEDLTLTSSFSGIQNSTMKISKKAQNINELQLGRLIVINGDLSKVCILEEMTTTLTDTSWTFTLLPLKGIMNFRLAVNYGHVWTQQTIGKIMSELVAYQTIAGNTSGANQNRMFPNMSRDILAVGDLIDYQEDWKPLGDTLTDLANTMSTYPLGWNVVISSGFTGYHYVQKQATDRSASQTTNNPVIFSEEYGNISNVTYTSSNKDYKNFAYVGDAYTQVWNGTDNNLSGFARREVQLNSTQAGTTNPTTAQITAEGQAQLKQRPKVNSLEAEIIANENTMSTYNKDWFLGDIVTIQSKEIFKGDLLTLNAQVTEIEETWANGQYSIKATFGAGKLSFVDLIKNAIKGQRG